MIASMKMLEKVEEVKICKIGNDQFYPSQNILMELAKYNCFIFFSNVKIRKLVAMWTIKLIIQNWQYWTINLKTDRNKGQLCIEHNLLSPGRLGDVKPAKKNNI